MIYIFLYIYLYIYIYIYIYTYLYGLPHALSRFCSSHARPLFCLYIYIYVYVYICIYFHTYIYITRIMFRILPHLHSALKCGMFRILPKHIVLGNVGHSALKCGSMRVSHTPKALYAFKTRKCLLWEYAKHDFGSMRNISKHYVCIHIYCGVYIYAHICIRVSCGWVCAGVFASVCAGSCVCLCVCVCVCLCVCVCAPASLPRTKLQSVLYVGAGGWGGLNSHMRCVCRRIHMRVDSFI